MIKIIFNQFSDQINDALNLLTSGKLYILVYSDELDHSLWEDYFAYLEVYLFIFQDLDLVYPAFDAYVLEDVDGKVYYDLGV